MNFIYSTLHSFRYRKTNEMRGVLNKQKAEHRARKKLEKLAQGRI